MGFLRGLGKLVHEVDEAIFPSGIYCLCCGSMIDRTRSYSLCDDCIRKFHWITGPTCDACGKALSERDPVIHGSNPRLCYDCMMRRPAFTKGFSCLTYGLHEREVMMDLKYSGKGYIARKFGDIMFDRIETEIRGGIFSAGCKPVDVIVPVPIGEERYIERGYNQSAFMAAQLARRWREHVKYDPPSLQLSDKARAKAPVVYEDLLFRTKATRKLRSLTPAERELELSGVFKVTPRYRSIVTGKSVLLIDDIYTTGATANACSRALLDAGAGEVFLLTLASGGNRRP